MKTTDGRTEHLLSMIGESIQVVRDVGVAMVRFTGDPIDMPAHDTDAWCLASSDIKVGDILVRTIGSRRYHYEVIDTRLNYHSNDIQEMQVRRVSE
jgi:hypothetical protein